MSGRSQVDVLSIPNPELGHYLRREQKPGSAPYEIDLAGVFSEILTRANGFVPSESGSIFIDDPFAEREGRPVGELIVVACFGERAGRLVGSRLLATRGIVGHVYATGEVYATASPAEDPLFFSGYDGASRQSVRSLVCAPLIVEGQTIGCLELLNRWGPLGFDERDLKLLLIFAQTIQASIANTIDAHRSKEMAKRDDLTGLYNDRFLHHQLRITVQDAVERDDECGLIFLDLDHFKTVNDVHGHLAGSRVLAEVGAMLRQILPGHAIGARYGGDEFIVVLPGAGRQETAWVAETVRQSIEHFTFLEHPDPIDPENYPALRLRGLITASVGITTLRGDVLRLLGSRGGNAVTAKNELIRLADGAMYVAKEGGRNRVVAAWQMPESG